MKIAITVQGGPYQSQAALSALHFARAVINSEHELYRVFFYHDGVVVGNSLMTSPQDEIDIHGEWVSLAQDNNLELVVCIASALRRGIVNAAEADRYEKNAANLDPAFTISGLGQWIDAGLSADRLVSFT